MVEVVQEEEGKREELMIQGLYRTEASEKQVKNFCLPLAVFDVDSSCLTLRSGECIQAQKIVCVCVCDSFCLKDLN